MTATFSPPHQRRDVAVLVPAAGMGVRLGGARPKALLELGGKPLLWHCLRNIGGCAGVGVIVVAVPPLVDPDLATRLFDHGLPDVIVVAGGATRQESVAAALAAVAPEFDIVLVHDAARALTPPELFERIADAVRDGHDAVIPVLPVVDTIKEVAADGLVMGTIDRAQLRVVQTPQGFRRSILVKAHGLKGEYTDDAGMVERLGVPVHTVTGHPRAFKITAPWDLVIAGAILSGSGEASA